jgi:hypothetical protein
MKAREISIKKFIEAVLFLVASKANFLLRYESGVFGDRRILF